ncbi:uncharacterized protein LODBEIA_P50470 [Lodderomyces beijingensis]|uniref:J domain-containing protein n=1 Tax=Lodderomyces beijingensis TaxID=1775926 RepID=A0ABP0ZRN8_9ASCO
MDQRIAKIIKDNVDIYEALQVPPDAPAEEIRRAYRKQALLHHPDKQTTRGADADAGADADTSQFNLILTSFQILSDANLRGQYDNLRRAKLSKLASQAHVDGLVRRFQDDLLSGEKKNNNNNNQRSKAPNLDQLREDGIKRRRLQEDSLRQRSRNEATSTIRDFPQSFPLKLRPATYSAQLKYKYKPGVEIDESILREIMGSFGPVKNATLGEQDERYAYATIEYDDARSLQHALEYDYSSAKKWDGTRVRKLASLLRSFKKFNGDDGDGDGDEQKNSSQRWTDNPVVNEILDEYVRSVSDKNMA